MTIRLAILTLTLFAFVSKSDKIISGKIYSSDHPQYYSTENIFVILRSNNVPFDTVRTNKKGEFLAIIPKDRQRSIDILYSGIGFGTVYLRYIEQLNDDTTHLQIDLAAKYEKNIFGTAVCPMCKEADLVYKIRYGDAPIYTARISDSGDTTYSPIHNGVYEAGTSVSTRQNAQWYCDRDKIQF